MENAWQNAQENTIGLLDNLEELDEALLRKDERTVREVCAHIASQDAGIRNAWNIPEDDGEVTELTGRIRELGKGFTMEREAELRAAMEQLGGRLKEVTDPEKEQPNFFRIGYYTLHGGTADPKKESVSAINAKAREALDAGFMKDFLEDVKKALAHSASVAEKARAEALQTIREQQSVFRADNLDQAKCRAAASPFCTAP